MLEQPLTDEFTCMQWRIYGGCGWCHSHQAQFYKGRKNLWKKEGQSIKRNCSDGDFENGAKDLVAMYDGLLSTDLGRELADLRTIWTPPDGANASDMLARIMEFGKDAFPNVTMALKILLTTAVSVASCERAFSKLKLIETDRRSSMGQERLSNLALLSIESGRTQKLSESAIIDEYFRRKKRGRGGWRETSYH